LIGVNEGTGRYDLGTQLHQFCFYPRALMTPSDAVFVAKMIRTMHDLGTNGLYAGTHPISRSKEMDIPDLQFFNESLPACIFACTESEARNLGESSDCEVETE
jgi:THO complex subunit 2